MRVSETNKLFFLSTMLYLQVKFFLYNVRFYEILVLFKFFKISKNSDLPKNLLSTFIYFNKSSLKMMKQLFISWYIYIIYNIYIYNIYIYPLLYPLSTVKQ